MTLRNYQIYTLIILGTLFCVPWVASAASFIQETLWGIVVAFFGLFLGLAGYLLDSAINDYVVGFGFEFTTKGIGFAVDTLWYAVRDIFNLTFIFGLVFIGFKMILNSDDSNTRRWLINLIMAALLVNFSLFITKFIVDFSNIVATQIAHALPVDPKVPGEVSVSHGFMNVLGLQSTLGIKHGDIPDGVDGAGAYGFILGTMMMFIVMTFVFAAGGILLLIRYAALCLYMVLSPLMFLGWVFPQLQSVTASYWRGFLGRAFFAPIYLLLVYFSYFVLAALYKSNAASGVGTPDYIHSMTGGGTSVGASFGATFPPFILVCIFLIASIVVANKMGADGASAALRVGNSAKNWTQQKAQRAAWGTTKFAASQTAGRAARRTSYALGNKLNQQIDRLQQKEGRLGKLARMNGVDDFTRGASGKMQSAKFGLSRTVKEDREKSAAIGAAADKRNKNDESASKGRVAQIGYELGSDLASNKNLTQEERENALKMRQQMRSEAAARVRNMDDTNLLQLSQQDLTRLSEHLTDKQIETLEKSGKFSTFGKDSDIQKIKDARDEATFKDYVSDLENTSNSTKVLGDALKGLADTVKGLSADRMAGLGASRLSDERVAMHISDDQIKGIQESGKFSATEINDIKAARTRGLNAIATGGVTSNLTTDPDAQARGLIGTGADTAPATPEFAEFIKTQQQNLMTRGASKAGELPPEVFMAGAMAQYITPEALEQRMRNGSVTEKQKEAIEKNIKDFLADTARATENDRRKWAKWTERTIGSNFDFGSTPQPSQPSQPQTPTIDTSSSVSQALHDRDQRRT